MRYTLTLYTVPPITFDGADVAAVGESNAAINGELPSLPITIDNARGDHTQVLAAADLLRARADLREAGVLIFAGAVQTVSLGAAVVLELEA